MFHSRGSLILLTGLAFLAPGPPLHSETPERGKTPQTDSYGDPLPKGAIARLGTIRLRHADEVRQVAFASDGKSIVSLSMDGRVHRWDAATGKRLHDFRVVGQREPAGRIPPTMIFSRDGRRLATVREGKDGTPEKIMLWDTATGKACGTLNNVAESSANHFAFSGDAKLLLVSNSGGDLRLFDTDSGRERRVLRWGDGYIQGIAFSADDKMLAAASPTAGVALWTVASGVRERTFAPPAAERMTAVAFAPDGKTLATGTEEGTIQLWDRSAGKVLHSFRDSRRHKPLNFLFMRFSPDGRTLLLGDVYNESILLLDTTTGKVVRKLEGIAGGARCAAFSPDGKTLVTGDDDHCVRLWSVETAREKLPSDQNAVLPNAIALSGDGKVLAMACVDRTLRLWAVPSGKPLRTLGKMEDGAYCLAFSPDDTQLATGGVRGTLRFWDVASGRILHQIEAHSVKERDKRRPVTVLAIAFSPDGKIAASGGSDSRVRLWDVATGKQRHVLAEREGWVFALAFSPDGKTLAGGGATDDSGDTCLWDAASGKLLRKLPEEGAAALTLQFSRDGKVLVAAGGLLGYWHLDFVQMATGKSLASFVKGETKIGDDAYLASAMAADGRTLALGGASGVMLWEMASRRPIRDFRGEGGYCSHVALTPDGRTLIAQNGDGTVLFWDLTGRAEDGRLRAEKLSAKSLEKLWTLLDSAEPGPAYRAFWELAAAPEDAVAFLRTRLRPTDRLDLPRVHRLIENLDSAQFTTRDKATKELAELHDLALPAMRAALAARPGLELRKRLEHLVRRAEDEMAAPGRLRQWRTLAALEQMRTPAARKLLENLSEGEPRAWLTREAKASLRRVRERSSAKP